MPPTLSTLLQPSDFAELTPQHLSGATCVVFDVLRATSTFVTALAHGAAAVAPAADIAEALALRERWPHALLGGERGGRRIGAELTGGMAFDLGNSPREYTPDRVRGRIIISTTTNGTRALRSCAGAQRVLAASFLNLNATTDAVLRQPTTKLLLVCAGTGDEAAWEDTLAAGALAEALTAAGGGWAPTRSARFAAGLYGESAEDLLASMQHSLNARRLLSDPDLAPDVALCLRRDTLPIVVEMGTEGLLRVARTD